MKPITQYLGKRVHMVGVGGSSMSGLCKMLKRMGVDVSGSDRTRGKSTDALERLGVPVTIGHSEQAVHGCELLIYTAAVHPDAPERAEATRLGIPQMERSELLGQLMALCRRGIAVSGVHGKTSTTSMAAAILYLDGLNPTIHIGGELDLIGGNVYSGGDELFLTEACEFAGSFLTLHPYIAVVLNIDADHLDWYRDIDHIQETFAEFLTHVDPDGAVVGCAEDPRVMQLLANSGRRAITYALEGDADYTARDIRFDATGNPSFTVLERGQPLCECTLRVAGRHMMLNSLAAVAATRAVGASPEGVSQGLNHYAGAHRRFEYTGSVQGVRLYHDYGHHPTEVKTVIPVALLQPHNKLWVVHQPHTYSRTKVLFDEFAGAFAGADEVLVTDIYGARETDPGDIHATQVADAIRDRGVPTAYTPTFEDARDYLLASWQPGDLVLTVGCGNVNLLNDLIQELEPESAAR